MSLYLLIGEDTHSLHIALLIVKSNLFLRQAARGCRVGGVETQVAFRALPCCRIIKNSLCEVDHLCLSSLIWKLTVDITA